MTNEEALDLLRGHFHKLFPNGCRFCGGTKLAVHMNLREHGLEAMLPGRPLVASVVCERCKHIDLFAPGERDEAGDITIDLSQMN